MNESRNGTSVSQVVRVAWPEEIHAASTSPIGGRRWPRGTAYTAPAQKHCHRAILSLDISPDTVLSCILLSLSLP